MNLKAVICVIAVLGLFCYFFLFYYFGKWTHYDNGQPYNLDRVGFRREEKTYSSSKFPIIIIGSGPTALGAAQRLHESKEEFPNISVIILEQSGKPGGLASSERDEEGFLWDMGGHVVFSHYQYFDATLDSVVKEWNWKQRGAYTFMRGSDDKRRFIPYPVQNYIEVMDKVDQQKILAGLEEVAKHPVKEKPANFDQWLLRNFGIGLCEVFMRKYNRKVWTVNTTEMNSDWVNERVAVPDIANIKQKIAEHVDGTPTRGFGWGPNNVFRFPRYNGTGGIWQAVADSLPRKWFRYNHRVTGIDINSMTVTVKLGTEGNNSIHKMKFASLISTAPLDLLVIDMIKGRDGYLQDMRKLATRLVYSRTHVIGIGLTGQPPLMLANMTWIYFPDSDSPFYRVTVFSSYAEGHVPKPGKQWSLMCEIAEPKHNSSPEKWTKRHLIQSTIQALIAYGFVSSSKMIISKYYRRLDHGYPVPSIAREMILENVQPWLQSKNIYSRGRFGGWRYEVSNQDHSFMQGVEVIDKLLKGIPEVTYFYPKLVNSRRNTDRVLRKSLMDYEIVVAHYNEKLTWLAPIANHSHVYHKGNELRPPPLQVNAWEKLLNVGRESHTYLYHIIKYYEKLPDIIVFIQGEGPSGYCFKTLNEILNKARNNIPCKLRGMDDNWGLINHRNKWLMEKISGHMRPSNFTFGEFFQELFNSPHPENYAYCLKACIAATREMIQRHPIDFYRKAISFVDDHVNPEEGHYFERLWYTIFSGY